MMWSTLASTSASTSVSRMSWREDRDRTWPTGLSATSCGPSVSTRIDTRGAADPGPGRPILEAAPSRIPRRSLVPVSCFLTGFGPPVYRSCASPSEYLKSQILADTMVFSDEGLRHLVAEMGVGQVVYGTDVPFNWPVTVDLVLNAPFLSDDDRRLILGGTLEKLLKLSNASGDPAI